MDNSLNPTAFPRQDARTLADDGDELHFCSTCAFSQACLAEGMDWCKKRQVLLQLTMGKYNPAKAPTSLQDFATRVARGAAGPRRRPQAGLTE